MKIKVDRATSGEVTTCNSEMCYFPGFCDRAELSTCAYPLYTKSRVMGCDLSMMQNMQH